MTSSTTMFVPILNIFHGTALVNTHTSAVICMLLHLLLVFTRYSDEGNPVVATKGDECGQFHFGSTVVLVFEAEDFTFSINPGM